MGATIRDNNPLTLNPGTNTEASQKHTPLTTKENIPKLKKFRGRDSADITGLTAELTSPIDKAAIKATGNEAMLTPGKAMSTTSRLRAVAIKVKKNPSIFFSKKFIKIFQSSQFLPNRTLAVLSTEIDFSEVISFKLC